MRNIGPNTQRVSNALSAWGTPCDDGGFMSQTVSHNGGQGAGGPGKALSV